MRCGVASSSYLCLSSLIVNHYYAMYPFSIPHISSTFPPSIFYLPSPSFCPLAVSITMNAALSDQNQNQTLSKNLANTQSQILPSGCFSIYPEKLALGERLL